MIILTKNAIPKPIIAMFLISDNFWYYLGMTTCIVPLLIIFPLNMGNLNYTITALQTLDRQTLDMTKPRQTNTRHVKLQTKHSLVMTYVISYFLYFCLSTVCRVQYLFV